MNYKIRISTVKLLHGNYLLNTIYYELFDTFDILSGRKSPALKKKNNTEKT